MQKRTGKLASFNIKMSHLFKWCWDLVRGKHRQEEVPSIEEQGAVPLSLKRRIEADEPTSSKRMRWTEMEKTPFRVEGKWQNDMNRGEWTTSSDRVQSRLGNPLMESTEVISNKENVLAMNSYRENHERTTSSISKSEVSVLDDSDDDPVIVRELPGSSSPISKRIVNHPSLPSQDMATGARKKTLRESMPHQPIHSTEVPTVVLSDEEDVQVIEQPLRRNGKRFFSTPFGVPMNYSSASTRKPSDVLRSIKSKPLMKSKSLLQESKHNNTISTVNNIKEKRQFQDLIMQYTHRNKSIGLTPRTRYLDTSPNTLLRSHPVITIDQSGENEVTVVGVVKSREAQPVTTATLTNEIFAKPKQPSARKFLADSAFSDEKFLKQTSEKYRLRYEETERNIQKPKAVAEFLAAQNKRSTTACEEHLLASFRRMEIVLPDVIEVPKLPELTEKMQAQISSAMRPTPGGEVLVEAFSLRITRNDMHKLYGTNWLNDEVINYYMNLLIERGKLDGFLNVYAFNTFFYPKLLSGGHSSLKRWTRKVDIFAQDLVIVPVHLGVHWCLASIDFRDQTIRYYDSMGSKNNTCLMALLQYLREESLDKKKSAYDTSSWKTVNLDDIPQQMNGSDCGMFACMFAEFICRNARITFTQDDMPYFRRKMAYELLTKRLMDFKT